MKIIININFAERCANSLGKLSKFIIFAEKLDHLKESHPRVFLGLKILS